MTKSDYTEEACNGEDELSFGESLSIERKRQNLSVADVANAIHLSEKMIDAIDRSDVSALPQPAFVQGYLRVYAKFLGISDAQVLQNYAQVVPHRLEADLQPRSALPEEATSRSPFVRVITVLLLIVMVVAMLYASFDYYKKAIEKVEDTDQDEKSSLSLPELDIIDIKELEPESLSELHKQVDNNSTEEDKVASVNSDVEIESTTLTTQKKELQQVAKKDVVSQKPVNQLLVEGDDSLSVLASQVSWIEVEDSNGQNLYYDLLQKDQQILLKGTAPFKVFLGNAPQVKVKVNDMLVALENYIRSNSTASFTVSVDHQKIVFY